MPKIFCKKSITDFRGAHPVTQWRIMNIAAQVRNLFAGPLLLLDLNILLVLSKFIQSEWKLIRKFFCNCNWGQFNDLRYGIYCLYSFIYHLNCHCALFVSSIQRTKIFDAIYVWCAHKFVEKFNWLFECVSVPPSKCIQLAVGQRKKK